jgi:isopenicillin-N N-acyltransferase-like protein
LLTTFHPNDGSFAYTTLGWAGMYGTITGWSSSNLAVSEKVWDAYKGIDNIFGYPWTLMLQDMMRFDSDIDEALARLGQSVRTCAIWLGLGQGARPNPRNPNVTLPADFKLVGDSFEYLHIYNPENFPIYPPAHDYFPQLLFVNKHVQPSKETCMNDLMHWGYGSLQASDFYTTITALEETGDMHIAVMDFDAKKLYIANAQPMPNNSPAYNNGFIEFQADALWNQAAPSL